MTQQRSRSDHDPDETVEIEALIREVVPNPDVWTNEPNSTLGGRRPRDYIHGPDESILRDMLRAAKHGYSS